MAAMVAQAAAANYILSLLGLTYGNHSAMITLIKKIGQREGFGDMLAEGTMRMAKRIGKGSEAYAMQVKGLELPAYEPRALKATGYGFATANIGGHCGYGSLALPIGSTNGLTRCWLPPLALRNSLIGNTSVRQVRGF